MSGSDNRQRCSGIELFEHNREFQYDDRIHNTGSFQIEKGQFAAITRPSGMFPALNKKSKKAINSISCRLWENQHHLPIQKVCQMFPNFVEKTLTNLRVNDPNFI
jgi:hypothetical protein